MKRIELLKRTGICITALALSAMIGAANPMMTALASEGGTNNGAEVADPNGDGNGGSTDDGDTTDDGENSSEGNSQTGGNSSEGNSQAGENSSEGNSQTEGNSSEGNSQAGGNSSEGNSQTGGNSSEGNSQAGGNSSEGNSQTGGNSSEGNSQAGGNSSEGNSQTGGNSSEGNSQAGGNSSEGNSQAGGNSSDGNSVTNGDTADDTANAENNTNGGDQSSSGSGQSGSSNAAEDASQAASDSSGTSSSQSSDSSSSQSGDSGSSSSQAASDSSSSATTATPTSESETPASDTEKNQPQQTSSSTDPTGKYKDKGTTLDPGETPTGYEQTLNYSGSNADLIASQNIVSGLSIIKDDFRFYTIDKVTASSSKKQSVYEEMDGGSREIGSLSKNDILYILSEEENDWLYVESGNVRGFVKKEAVERGSKAESSGEILSFAEETVPASENKAFAYKRCTTKSTVIDKNYAISDVDSMILESTSENAREIGHLAPGSLCYVIQQADEKWSYVESGNVRGFVRTSNLTTGTAAKKIVQQTGEATMTGAQEYVKPADNKALYYTLNSVHDGVVYSSIRTEIVEAAAKCIGNPYVWGGTSLTNGADCSGFVQTLYAMFGYNIPRVADAQSQYGIQIPVSDAAPGDLIFFASNGYVYHVALYAGDGMTIEAYSENRGIIATPIGNRDAVWATRVIED